MSERSQSRAYGTATPTAARPWRRPPHPRRRPPRARSAGRSRRGACSRCWRGRDSRWPMAASISSCSLSSRHGSSRRMVSVRTARRGASRARRATSRHDQGDRADPIRKSRHTMTIKISTLGHVVLRTPDLAPARAFYRRPAGLQEVAAEEFDGQQWVFLTSGSSHHELALVEDPSAGRPGPFTTWASRWATRSRSCSGSRTTSTRPVSPYSLPSTSGQPGLSSSPTRTATRSSCSSTPLASRGAAIPTLVASSAPLEL